MGLLANEAMRHFGLPSMHGIWFACILLCCEILQVSARNLRLHSQPQKLLRADALNSTVSAVALFAKGKDDIVLKVVKNTSLTAEDGSDCLCKLGEFWHWRIHQCVKQGPWGYECGFFPAEHWHRVCKDNLKCEALEGVEDNYHSHGKYKGTADSAPASCVACTKEDDCKVGEARHEEECLKEFTISGKACATVRVTLPMTAKATATKEVTVKITESKEASAKATETASHTAEVTATAKAKDAPEVEASASGKATAEKEATAEATKTAEASKSVTASSTVTKKTKAQGIAEETACVTAEEVMKEMGLDPKMKVGAVLAGKIISKGNEMAFKRAAAAATAAAKEAGLLDAKDAAQQLASAEAAEEARLKAEALARKAAAWEAEAGANKAAQAAASARAKEIAKEKAKLEAERLAHLEAEAAAAKAAAEKARAAAKKAAEAAEAAETDMELQGKADDAAAEANAAEAAAEEAAAAAQAQQDLLDVINSTPKAQEVPRVEPTKPPKFRKITDKQMAEKLP